MAESLINPKRDRLSHVSFVVLLHLAFAFIGTATTLLGVILPALAYRFSLSDAHSGNLFTVHFLGSFIGTFLAERLWLRYGFPATITSGLLIMCAGILGIGFLDFYGVVIGIFLNGIGIGLAIPATNLLVSALNPKRGASALNILNFVWSGGAMLCPAFVGLLANSFDIRLPLAGLSCALLIFALGFVFFAKFQNVSVGGDDKSASVFSPNVWHTRFVLVVAALLFFCVGAENSLSGWVTSYSLRTQETAHNSLWTVGATVFWLAFLLGRLLAPLFLRKISEKKFILLCLVLGAIGSGLLLAPPHFLFTTTGTALAGFGLAPVFPTTFAQFTKRFGETGATKWLFVSGTLGGAFLTWLVGFFSTLIGSLRSGLAATFFCFLMMILLQTILLVQSEPDDKG